jgi:hypothetical protein
MPRAFDTFLAQLGLDRADHPTHQSGHGPAIQIVRADLNHAVLSRMLESAEALAGRVAAGSEA